MWLAGLGPKTALFAKSRRFWLEWAENTSNRGVGAHIDVASRSRPEPGLANLATKAGAGSGLTTVPAEEQHRDRAAAPTVSRPSRNSTLPSAGVSRLLPSANVLILLDRTVLFLTLPHA